MTAAAEVFLASRNAKKIAEMERILREHLTWRSRCSGSTTSTPYDEPVEDQPTFEGNALLKARAGLAATGLPSLADDSGLCVDALNGMPGVLSARWSGPPKSRRAQQRAAAAPAGRRPRRPPRRPLHLRGRVLPPGRPASWSSRGGWPAGSSARPRGSGGFGYDVLFVADDHPGPTTAELSIDDKDAISHRGQALRQLAPLVAQWLGSGG